MKRNEKAQISVLAGVFGFFTGGLLNAGKEILDIMLGAAIGWGIAFFIAFIVIQAVFPDTGGEDHPEPDDKSNVENKKKGGLKKGSKIDLIAKDNMDLKDIYNLKK